MRLTRFAALYRRHFRDHRRERMALASASFFVTFATARALVHGFRDAQRPLEIWVAGVHLHHYVMGIGLLLAVGYLWLIQIGSGATSASHRLGRITSLLYGIGAALTLDEFALWLHLDDVYWQPTGRVSIDAVVLFGALVSVGVWGGPFWRAVARQIGRLARRGRRSPAAPAPTASEVADAAVRQIEALLSAPPPAAAEIPIERDPVR